MKSEIFTQLGFMLVMLIVLAIVWALFQGEDEGWRTIFQQFHTSRIPRM
jgi:hypothetical protein